MSIGLGRALIQVLAGVIALTLTSIASTSIWAFISTTSPDTVAAARSRPAAPGYWMVASDGGIPNCPCSIRDTFFIVYVVL